jgi:hypothetical protein
MSHFLLEIGWGEMVCSSVSRIGLENTLVLRLGIWIVMAVYYIDGFTLSRVVYVEPLNCYLFPGAYFIVIKLQLQGMRCISLSDRCAISGGHVHKTEAYLHISNNE